MSGIYIHIPYCKKSCFYCDFHFSVNKKNIGEMVQAIKNEIEYFGKNQQYFFDTDEKINTIYFGGGTPSLLTPIELAEILNKIYKNYNISQKIEITLEANPDNLTAEYCQNLKEIGINRLSIGIQSFFDEHLKWMNRSHNSEQALNCIENAQKSGLKNLNLDLIYGFFGLTDKQWNFNLETIEKTGVKHISCYNLTVEEKTPLKKLIEKGKYFNSDENKSILQFEILQNWAAKNNWDHYEISNLCKENNFSIHNCSYWNNEKYLGIGPSAHSFNHIKRHWNIADNKVYIENLSKNKPCYNSEILSIKEKYNDYILTSLRTKWGIEIDKSNKISGFDFLVQNGKTLEKYINSAHLIIEKNTIKLSKSGMLLADKIASDLFLV
ncbi:MAG: radical SAM family heme chaperone HemW [Bacteroidetes bacterium]|nr:radical SAM family heme chaperone HemW [Bacteroidota bacterium]